MAEETSGSVDQAEEIQNKLNQALKELDEIRNTRQAVTDPEKEE